MQTAQDASFPGPFGRVSIFSLLFPCFITNKQGRIPGRSANKIPIGSLHLLKISDDEKRKQFAQGEIAVLKDRVLSVLDEIERDYSGDSISVSIFSGESDLIHSTADCIMMVSTHFTASRRTPLPRVSRRPPDTRTP